MKSPITKPQRGIVRRSRMTACMCHTHVWPQFHNGESLHVVNLNTGFLGLLRSWMYFIDEEMLQFLGNTDDIDLENPTSDILSFCCSLLFSFSIPPGREGRLTISIVVKSRPWLHWVRDLLLQDRRTFTN